MQAQQAETYPLTPSPQSSTSSSPFSSFTSSQLSFCSPEPITPSETEDSFPTKLSVIRESITKNDTSTIIQKLCSFKSLPYQQKQIVVDNLSVMLQEIGQKSIDIIGDVVDQIMGDQEMIRERMLSRIQGICDIAVKFAKDDLPKVVHLIQDKLMHAVIKLLYSMDSDIKKQASRVFASVSKVLSQLSPQSKTQILKQILLLAHDEQSQNNRLLAVDLLTSMPSLLGPQLTEQFIALQILSLSEDPSEKIKKQVLENLPQVCHVVSQLFFNTRILEMFYKKCGSKNWILRKQCADIIIPVGEVVNETDRQGKLTDVMLKLLKDQNKWVKLAAYLQLGKFIYLMKGLNVHEKLIKRYVKMIQPQIVELGSQNQIPYNCAFNFPAVVSVLGPSQWPTLSKTYTHLLSLKDTQIRRTLSSSLHEISKIIGGKQTQQSLFPIIDSFLEDQNKDIQLSIIQNMSEIIFVLNDKMREKMINIFQEFRQNKKQWRIRFAIAKQFQSLLEMYSTEIVHMYIVPIFLSFCSDPVAQVRSETAKAAKFFLQCFQTTSQSTDNKNSSYSLGLLTSLIGLGQSQLSTQRMQFIKICKQISQWNILKLEPMQQQLRKLTTDKIINVKIVLAEFIGELYRKDKSKIVQKYANVFGKKKEQNLANVKKVEVLLQKYQEIYRILEKTGDQEIKDMLYGVFDDHLFL